MQAKREQVRLAKLEAGDTSKDEDDVAEPIESAAAPQVGEWQLSVRQ